MEMNKWKRMMCTDLFLGHVKPKTLCLCAHSKKQMSRCNLTVWGEYSASSVLAHTYTPAVTSAVTDSPFTKKIQMLMQQVRVAKNGVSGKMGQVGPQIRATGNKLG